MSNPLNKHQKLISASDLTIIENKIGQLESDFPVELKFVVVSKHLSPFSGGLRLVVLSLLLLETLAYALWWPIPSQVIIGLLLISIFIPKKYFSALPFGWLFSYASERAEELELRASKYFRELQLMESPQRNCLMVVFVPQDKLFYFLPDQGLVKSIKKAELNILVESYANFLKKSSINDALLQILDSLRPLFLEKIGKRESAVPKENVFSNGVVFF